MSRIRLRIFSHNENAMLGFVYGALAGFAFAIAAWGIDGAQLAAASAGFPWLQFTIGAFSCILIGGLAGWLTARSDNTLVGVILWLAAGVIFGLIASHLPFEGITQAIHGLSSRLEFINYPYPENMRSRMVVIYFLIILCALLTGALQNVITDAANHASTNIARYLTLMVVFPIFMLAGWVTRDYISQTLSTPIVAVDELLQFSQEMAGKPIDPRLAAEKRYRALTPILDLVNQPYRLYLGGYNSDYMDTFNVLIDFQGAWAECSVVINMVTNCKRVGSTQNTTSGPVASSPLASTLISPSQTPAPASSSSTAQTSTPGKVSSHQEPSSPQDNVSANLADAPRYNLALNIDFDNMLFNGKAKVAYINNETVPLDRLYFRLIPNGQGSYGNGRLNVTQATLNGQPAATKLSLQDTVLEFSLPEPLQPGQGTQVDFTFDGVVPFNFGGAAEPAGYGIYNYVDGVMALANWYPILAVYDKAGWNLDFPSEIGDSVYSDMAYYTVDLTLPEDVEVAATGEQVHEQTDDGQQRLSFESGPMRDFFIIMSRDFQVFSQEIDGVQVNSYAQPKHAAPARQALDIAVDSLKVYNQKFGAYPYSELDVVAAPMQNAAGVEFPGIVLVADHLYDKTDDPTFATATAHEVAHQWWYNVVGNNVFDDPWMDEALTTYSSGLYYEDRYGLQGMQGIADYWQLRYQGLLERGTDDRITQTLQYFESLDDWSIYGRVVYSKGALFFDALRREIGDEAFFSALQNYYNEFQFSIAAPEDLLDAFEVAANRQLDDFYQKWLYTP